MDEIVNCLGRHAGRDDIGQRIETGGSQRAGLAHAGKAVFAIMMDRPCGAGAVCQILHGRSVLESRVSYLVESGAGCKTWLSIGSFVVTAICDADTVHE